MANKNKGEDNNKEKYIEELRRVLSQLDDKDLAKLLDVLLVRDPHEMLNEMFYRYEAPDYEAEPVADWLGPLLRVDDVYEIDDLCRDVLKAGEDLPLEQKREDIRNMFFLSFKTFRFAKEMEDNDWDGCLGEMSLVAAMYLMELLELEDCEDVVLESLRQDACYRKYYSVDNEVFIVCSLFRMCREKVDVLLDFLKEDGLIPPVKPVVFDTLVMIYLHCPKQRLKASAAIVNYLNYCHDICRQGAEGVNVDFYAYSLATAHVREALPLLKKLYRDVYIPKNMTEGYEDVEEIMNSDDMEFVYKYTSIEDVLADMFDDMFEAMFDDGFDDEFDEFDDEEDEDESTPPGLSRLYDPYEYPKIFTLRIAMLDALEPVERTITVSSTMYLNHLANIIMIALGHDGLPEDYCYFQDKYGVIYSSIDTCLEDDDTAEITEETIVGDVLKRKNSSVLLVIVDEDNTEWEISVLLESSSGKCRDDSHLDVKLTSGYGAYPPASCHTYSDYEKRFRQNKLKKPDFKKVQKKINDYLASKESSE